MFVREKILECTVKVKELFDKQEDALVNNKEGKIISLDLLSSKFIRTNIKLFDDTTTSSSKTERQNTKTSES